MGLEETVDMYRLLALVVALTVTHANQASASALPGYCIRSGVDIVSLKTLMNHASIQQTSEYVATNEDMLKKKAVMVL